MSQAVERAPGAPIDVDKLREQQAVQRVRLGGLIDQVKSHIPDEAARVVGSLMFGAPRRTVGNPDETVQTKEWSWDDIMIETDKMQAQGERTVRQGLTEELTIGLGQQDRFFRRTTFREGNRRIKRDARDVSSLTKALLQRVNDSIDDITYPYHEPAKEVEHEAEALEAVRRTVMKPAYELLGGHVNRLSGVPTFDEEGFWNDMRDRRNGISLVLNDHTDLEEYGVLQEEVVRSNPAAYSEPDWLEILADEKLHLKAYLNGRAIRSARTAREMYGFYSRLTENGEYVIPDQAVAQLKQRMDTLFALATDLSQSKGDFSKALPTARKHLGDSTSFESLLEYTNPTKTPAK